MFNQKLLILLFYKNLFAGKSVKLHGKTVPLETSNGLRQYRTRNLLFIEQDTKKKTKWAELAKEGTKIMWIISLPENKYLYKVQDGRIDKLKDFKKSLWAKKKL